MKAVVCSDYGESTIKEVEKPTLSDNWVMVKIHRVQLSVTDCRLYQGKDVVFGDAVRELLNTSGRLFGHEFCGTVVELGENVDSLAEGDRVYSAGLTTCGDCAYCKTGYRKFCLNTKQIGYNYPGTLSEYSVLPAEPLRSVPEKLSDGEVAALQPFNASLAGVYDADISFGDHVVVMGAGIMGYQIGQLALLDGASKVFAIDVNEKRLELAEEKGMIGVDPRDQETVNYVRDATNGIGADIVFEAVGGSQERATDSDDPIAQCFDIVRRGGKVVQVGIVDGDLSFNSTKFRHDMVQYHHPKDIAGVLPIGPNMDTGTLAPELVADGRVSISENITHVLEGLESFEDAVEITLNKGEYEALGPAQIVISESEHHHA